MKSFLVLLLSSISFFSFAGSYDCDVTAVVDGIEQGEEFFVDDKGAGKRLTEGGLFIKLNNYKDVDSDTEGLVHVEYGVVDKLSGTVTSDLGVKSISGSLEVQGNSVYMTCVSVDR